MLRDTLALCEIKEIFSNFEIFFLQILIGTPNSINLRNIVWHGFPSHDEVNTYYSSILVIIIRSFGYRLNELNFQITKRPNNYNPSKYFQNQELNKQLVFNEMLLQKSKYIPQSHYTIWERILECQKHQNYETGILLLLPQIELILRIFYGKSNEIDIRAQIDEYYIIMDSFFIEYIDVKCKKPNRIYQYLEQGLLKAIYDIFISIDGSRLRDKICHGECEIDKLNDIIFNYLMFLVSAIIDDSESAVYFKNYESKYHPNAKLNNFFSKISKNVMKLKESIIIPHELLSDQNHIKKATLIIPENSPCYRVKIFFRPQGESAIVTILIQISKNLNEIYCNLAQSLTTRLAQYHAKLLHSKRRKTLQKLINNLPEIYTTLGRVYNVILLVFLNIQKHDDSFVLKPNSFEKIIKCMRKILKYVENVTQYFSCDSCRWQECLDASKEVEEQIERGNTIINEIFIDKCD